jgi:hypothetical protein
MLQDKTTVMDKLVEVIDNRKTITLELDTSALIAIHTALLDNSIMAEMIMKAAKENPGHTPKDIRRIIKEMKTEDGVSFEEIHLDYNSSCDDVVMVLADRIDKALS